MIHTVVCPVCGHAQEFTAWASITPDLDPHLRSALLEGQLEAFACAACQALTRVAFDTLYHDMPHAFMIWLCHQNEPLEAPDQRLPAHYRFRVVRTVPSLLEKVRIFEDQLDDRVVEMFKVGLWSSLEPRQRGADGRLYYAGTRAEADLQMEFLLVRHDGVERLTISTNRQYLPFVQQVAPLTAAPLAPHAWWLINEEYATAELTRVP